MARAMESGYLCVFQLLKKGCNIQDRLLLNSIHIQRQFSLSAKTMAKSTKKKTKKIKGFKSKDEFMDYQSFQSTSNYLFGPMLKKKENIIYKGNDTETDLKARMEYLQDGEHFNKISDSKFVPFPETRNINKGKPLPFKKVESVTNNSKSEESDWKEDKYKSQTSHKIPSASQNSFSHGNKNLNDIESSTTIEEMNNVSDSSNVIDSNNNRDNSSINTKLQQNEEFISQETISETTRKLTFSKSLKTLESFPLSGQLDEELPFSAVLQPHVSALPREPSVGNILRETMSEQSKAALDRWMKKKIKELGEEGFQKYKQALFRNGSNFHECVAAQLENKPDIPLLPEVEPLWESVHSVFADISDVQLVETKVTHKQLGYMGILDSVVRYRDELVLVDWKTADRQKKTLDAAYDDPVQILAYIGALNSDPEFNINIRHGLLVVAYRDGRPADILEIPTVLCHMYWNQWLARLHKFWKFRLV